jgi:hypothetical protein
LEEAGGGTDGAVGGAGKGDIKGVVAVGVFESARHI